MAKTGISAWFRQYWTHESPSYDFSNSAKRDQGVIERVCVSASRRTGANGEGTNSGKTTRQAKTGFRAGLFLVKMWKRPRLHAAGHRASDFDAIPRIVGDARMRAPVCLWVWTFVDVFGTSEATDPRRLGTSKENSKICSEIMLHAQNRARSSF
jgi:hypothetical protein